MIHFNDDLFHVVCSIFAKHDVAPQYADTEPMSEQMWAELTEGGFTSIGPDAGIADHAALAKAVGACAVAAPVVENGLARWVADSSDVALCGNPRDVVICGGLNAADRIQANWSATGDQSEIGVRGTLRRVPWGRYADVLLVPVAGIDALHWVAVDRGDFKVTEGVNLASEPRDDITFSITVPATASKLAPSVVEVRARGALLRAAAGLGAMEFVLDSALEYSQQREQFGVPLISFQAVDHHLVQIAEAVAAVSAITDAAVNSEPEYRLMRVAAAKFVFGSQAAILAASAHQIFGAIGTTDEHVMHRRTRRLWSWEDEYGTRDDWAEILGRQLTFAGSPGAWPVLTPPLSELRLRNVGQEVAW